MDHKPWAEPVKFEETIGLVTIITNTQDAAEYLQHRWPIGMAPKHIEARQVCAAVLAGDRPAEEARDVLVDALRWAGFQVVA